MMGARGRPQGPQRSRRGTQHPGQCHPARRRPEGTGNQAPTAPPRSPGPPDHRRGQRHGRGRPDRIYVSGEHHYGHCPSSQRGDGDHSGRHNVGSHGVRADLDGTGGRASNRRHHLESRQLNVGYQGATLGQSQLAEDVREDAPVAVIGCFGWGVDPHAADK
jgi:hypothetical protein